MPSNLSGRNESVKILLDVNNALKVEALIRIWLMLLSVSRLKPEEKVNLAINMTDVCLRICAEGIREQHPDMTEKELVERVRERIQYARRRRREV
jgi:hypothetical protein